MSNLAQNQLDFQVYNQQLNGPRSPIDMDTLKANAVAEQKEQAALGKVFDANTQQYVETEESTRVEASTVQEKKNTTLGKRKNEELSNFKKSTYEVYTTTPVADEWGNKHTRVVYMEGSFEVAIGMF